MTVLGEIEGIGPGSTQAGRREPRRCTRCGGRHVGTFVDLHAVAETNEPDCVCSCCSAWAALLDEEGATREGRRACCSNSPLRSSSMHSDAPIAAGDSPRRSTAHGVAWPPHSLRRQARLDALRVPSVRHDACTSSQSEARRGDTRGNARALSLGCAASVEPSASMSLLKEGGRNGRTPDG